MKTKMFTFSGDNRYEENKIVSRIGISADANSFSEATDLFQNLIEDKELKKIKCVLIDEAQFLKKNQVAQLGKIVDELDIAVLAFGIRTDFQGELFEGSKYLLAWADNLKEIKTVCWCGRKATMVVRLDSKGNILSEGQQLEIGGNEKYVPLCRAHFNKKDLGN
jgi:thymidine kinase